MISAAQQIMETNKARQQAMQGTFTLDKLEFFEKRMTKIEDALIVEQANQCMAKCKQPVDIWKRIVSSQMKEISMNIQLCT